MHAEESDCANAGDGADFDGQKMAERDARGRFRPGWRGGPGRPPKTTELRFLRAVGDAVTEEDVQEIARAAVRAAKNGDSDARSWISRHLLPNPDKVGLSDARRSAARQEIVGYSTASMRVALDSIPVLQAGPHEHEDLAELLTEHGLTD